VLPEAKDGPSGRSEVGVDLAIAFNVPLELRLPEVCVDLGVGAVLRATVPKAAVNEHNESSAGECDIGTNGSFLQRNPIVLAEPEAGPVEYGSHFTLRCRIGSSI
jgi:hypothetical protein